MSKRKFEARVSDRLRHFLSLCLTTCSLCPFLNLHASPTTSVSFTPTLTSFHFEEFNENNKSLNTEKGVLPGIGVSIRRSHKYLNSEWELAMLDGSVKYEGFTNKGSIETTNTQERIVSLNLLLNKSFYDNNNYSVAVTSQFGYRYWKRNIESTQTTMGPLEFYTWTYFGAGLSLGYSTEKIKLDTRLTFLLAPQANIAFHLPEFDTTKTSLGQTRGLEFNFSVSDKKQIISLVAFAKVWSIQKNRPVTLHKNGAPTNILLTEPKSDTKIIGIGLNFPLQ